MGVSMKEAAQKVPWAKMADKVWAVGDAVMDKMEDLADKVQESFEKPAVGWCWTCAFLFSATLAGFQERLD